jgi:hypothetical protein
MLIGAKNISACLLMRGADEFFFCLLGSEFI